MNHKILLAVVIGAVIAGIFAIGEAIDYSGQQEIKTLIESQEMKDAIAQSDDAMESFNKVSEKSNKTLDAVIRSFD